MTTLESRDFIATESDIQDLTKRRISASKQLDNSSETYLKVLVATTQAELGSSPRQRQVRGEVAADDIPIQLAALEAVHTRFYAVVIATLQASLTGRNVKTQAQRKATKERTYKHLVRSWIKAGHDVRTLAAAKVTKPMLERELPDRPAAAQAKTLKRRALGVADRLVALAGEAAKTDRPSAVEALDAVMSLLGQQMASLAGPATTKPDIAIRDGRPFRRGGSVFWPVATDSVN